MNNTSPESSHPVSRQSGDHSKAGVISFVFGLLALLIAAILIGGFFSQRYWDSSGNNLIDILRLPCITPFLILLGVSFGFISVAEKSSKPDVFGILGLWMSLITIVACGCLFALIFASSGGFGG